MKISQIALLIVVVQPVHSVVVDVHQAVVPPEDIKTVTHTKKANSGYQKGSPLYDKQEKIKGKGKAGDEKDKKAEVPLPTALPTDANSAATGWVDAFGSVYRGTFYETLASVSVYAVFVLAFAYIARSRMLAPLGARAKGESPMKQPAVVRCGFAYSFFDFGNLSADWHICLTAYCCPIIQWARTASSSVTPFMGYWKAVALLLTMVVLAPFTYGLTGLVVMIVVLMRRRELRKAYSHGHSETRGCLEDFLLVCCCPSFLCCQLVQEAREVEYTSPKQPA